MSRQLTWSTGLISFVALFTAISPFLADFNATHVYNAAGPGHARFHNGQTMTTGLLCGLFSLYFLWGKPAGTALENLKMACLFAAFYWLAMAPAILYPGTTLSDPELGGVGPPIICSASPSRSCTWTPSFSGCWPFATGPKPRGYAGCFARRSRFSLSCPAAAVKSALAPIKRWVAARRLRARTGGVGAPGAHHGFVVQVAPITHGLHHAEQGLAVRGAGVLHRHGPGVADRARDELVLLHLLQLLGQHAGRNADFAAQLLEAVGAPEQHGQDDELPLAADNVEGIAHGLVLAFGGGAGANEHGGIVLVIGILLVTDDKATQAGR